LIITPCLLDGLRLRGSDAWFTTFHSQWKWVALVGRGACSCWDPVFACSGRGPRGYIRGEVCAAGPNPLCPPSKQSAPTVLCRARRGVPGHASCVLAVLVCSSGVLNRDYRASRQGRPLGWGWVCCDATPFPPALRASCRRAGSTASFPTAAAVTSPAAPVHFYLARRGARAVSTSACACPVGKKPG